MSDHLNIALFGLLFYQLRFVAFDLVTEDLIHKLDHCRTASVVGQQIIHTHPIFISYIVKKLFGSPSETIDGLFDIPYDKE